VKGYFSDSAAVRRRIASAGLAAVFSVILTILAGPARSLTSDGTVITNIATITLNTTAGAPLTVSYCATATALVLNPCAKILKSVSPTTQSAAGTLTYRVWIASCSDAVSSFNVTVTDRLPSNVLYADSYVVWNGLTAGASWSVYRSSDNVSYSAGEPNVGQASPYYLRWIYSLMGPNKSAYIEYAVKIQ